MTVSLQKEKVYLSKNFFAFFIVKSLLLNLKQNKL